MRAVAITCLLLLTACSDQGPVVAGAGTYDLVAINGDPLPTIICPVECHLTYSGELVLRIDRSVSGRWTVADAAAPADSTTLRSSGTWSIDGATITLEWPTGTEPGTLESGRLYVDAFTYERR